FQTKEGFIYRDLPCHLYLPLNTRLPTENCDYTIVGTLQQKGDYLFVLKPQKNTPWIPVKDTHTFAFLRHRMKKEVRACIKKEIPDKSAQILLTALATGEIDERLLSLEFGKIGLQHLLAISGFHFGLIALFLKGMLRSCFPSILTHALLL